MSSENQKFLIAMIAPTSLTLLGLMLQSKELLTAGIIFMCLIVFARWLRRRPY